MVVYIETERLRLRNWKEKDLLSFQKMNANPQVGRYLPSLLSYRRSELDMQQMDDILKEKGTGLFAVKLKETGAWLGYIGLNYLSKDGKYPFENLPIYETGWRLIPGVWGSGIATEGAMVVLEYVKEKGIEEVFSPTAEGNSASRKVMEKIGVSLLDYFELPELSKYHPLKRHVRYQKRLNI